jgi:hypothetical protein
MQPQIAIPQKMNFTQEAVYEPTKSGLIVKDSEIIH